MYRDEFGIGAIGPCCGQEDPRAGSEAERQRCLHWSHIQSLLLMRDLAKSNRLKKSRASSVAFQPMKQTVSAKKQIIKVLVADDHPVVRKGVQICLAKQEE